MTKIRVVMLSDLCDSEANIVTLPVVASIFCEAICLFCCHVERSEVSSRSMLATKRQRADFAKEAQDDKK
jgi:hypothetical protein